MAVIPTQGILHTLQFAEEDNCQRIPGWRQCVRWVPWGRRQTTGGTAAGLAAQWSSNGSRKPLEVIMNHGIQRVAHLAYRTGMLY